MAQFKKLTQSEVYNELQNNFRNIHAPYTFLNLTPHRSVSDYEYFKQRKSELYCMNRADIKVLVVWIINSPKDLNPSDEEKFFQLTYQFLEDRYGVDNVIQAYVHYKDQTIDCEENPDEIIIERPHLHFCFIPVVADANPNHPQSEKICANDVLGPDLYHFHPDLQQYLKGHGISTGIAQRASNNPSSGKTFCSFFEFFKFQKDKKITDTPSDTLNTFSNEDSLLHFAKSVSKILKIDCPKIEYVDCLYDTPDGICSVNAPYLDTIPQTNTYIGAFFDTHNTIYITRKFPIFTNKNQVQFDDLQFNDQSYLLIHELRHIWQHKYYFDLYYAYNARGFEVLDDISEIDADAFALLFLFSGLVTEFYLQPKNLSATFCSVFAQAKLDKNARINQAKKLSKEYTWGNWNKLSDFNAQVCIKNFDLYKKILRKR